MANKLSIIVIAGSALTTTVGAAAAATNKILPKLKNQHPMAATKSLLQKARPYRNKKSSNANALSSNPRPNRRLDGDFDIDGTYSLKFSQCVDVKLFDQDLFEDEVIEYTQAGQIISAQSYVLFHVCLNDDCYYESEDDLYLVDLATYVNNVASYHASAKSDYCDACATYYDGYCNAQADDYAAANDDAAANNGDDAGAYADDMAEYYNGDDANNGRKERKLQMNGRRRTTSYIDCDQCEAYGCTNNGDDDAQQGDDDNGVLELIEDISQCLNTGLNWNDDELYVGFMCSPYGGDGVELAIFLDNQCSVYTSLKSFSDIPSWYIYNDEDMFAEAEAYIKNAFTETTPCLLEEFGDPAYQNNGDDDGNDDGNDDGYEVNDFCGNIFEEGPIEFSTCGQNDDGNNNNNQDQNNDNDDNYNWYSYDMNYDDARDLDEVCLVLQQMEGEYEYHYDEENSGTWNDHSDFSWGGSNGSGKKSKGNWNFMNNLSGSFASSGIMITFYVMLGFSLVVGVLFVVGVHEKKRRERSVEPFYTGTRLV